MIAIESKNITTFKKRKELTLLIKKQIFTLD